MPEIAEVEIIRLGLEPLVGQRLEAVEVSDPKLAHLSQSAPVGARLTGTLRHGKRLGLLFAEQALVLHLRMTGSILLEEDPRARMTLFFDSDGVLAFIDPRRFGTVTVGLRDGFSERLGPDLFLLDPASAGKSLAETHLRSTVAAKSALLDQAKIAGVGNYLADEAFWAARIHPTRPAKTLSTAEWERLLSSAQGVAELALFAGGASFSDYVQTDGGKGEMQSLLKAYGRVGKPCESCGKALTKIRVGGRGTTLCAHCQL